MAFGLVLFTLLIQGFSMDWLTKRLKIVQRTPAQDEYERRHARFIAGRAAYDFLRRQNQRGLISEHTWQKLAPMLKEQNARLVDGVKQVMTSDPAVEAEELDTARREALRAQRNAIRGLLRDGVITEETYVELLNEVDEALMSDSQIWPKFMRTDHFSQLPIRRLMAAVIQHQDVEPVTRALEQIGLSVVQIPSKGGFLRRGNVTLLIGLAEGSEEEAVNTLKENSQHRVEYQSALIPELPGVRPTPVPVKVGGATIFTFEVETWEEF
jgi:uncharacterized protein YaaQ/ribosomal protein L19E